MKPETLAAAFSGAHAIYMCTPPSPMAVKMAESILTAAKAAGRPHMVRLSVIKASTNGPNDNVKLHAQSDDLVSVLSENTLKIPNHCVQAHEVRIALHHSTPEFLHGQHFPVD
jgi:hypothetical protein